MKTAIKNNLIPAIAMIVISLVITLVVMYVIKYPVISYNHFIK